MNKYALPIFSLILIAGGVVILTLGHTDSGGFTVLLGLVAGWSAITKMEQSGLEVEE